MLERRAKSRFSFQQPVSIRVRVETGWLELQGITQNASMDGVQLTAYPAIPIGSDVKLTVAMPHDVSVSCSGKVIQVEPRPEEGRMGVVVQCTKPFDELLVNRY